MSDILRAMVIAALIWAAILTAFIGLLRSRWFARFSQGFLLTLLIALVSVSLMAASVVGVWGYEASRNVLWNELVTELGNVADIVEGQVRIDLRHIQGQLENLAADVAPHLKQTPLPARLQEELADVQHVNPLYLQLTARDREGHIVASTSASDPPEPVTRIGAAYALEGQAYVSDAYESADFDRQILYIAVPIKDPASGVVGALSTRFDLQTNLTELIGATRFNATGYAVLVRGDGRIIAHKDGARVGDDVSSYPAVQAALRSGGAGAITALNSAGEERLMVYRSLKGPASVDPKPWILLTEINQEEALLPLSQLRDEFAQAIAVLLFTGVLIAVVLSSSIQRPVDHLAGMVEKVKSGDLTARAGLGGKDVLGQLGARLDEMVKGLEERDRVKEVFGRYIATQVSDKILKGEIDLGGDAQRVTILFSDIRNFSAMAEKMTPGQVVSFLNDYFSEMVEAVFEQGGVLDKFLGDGLMAVFGSLGDQPDHPRRAVLTALRMKARLGKINGDRSVAGKAPIAIGIGIHTDEVIVGNIGSRRRLEYTVIGDGVNTSSRVQALNKEFGTTILITETTFEAVGDEFECRQMPAAQLRGKTKPLTFYEVVSAREGTAKPGVAIA